MLRAYFCLSITALCCAEADCEGILPRFSAKNDYVDAKRLALGLRLNARLVFGLLRCWLDENYVNNA
jgi:hypothetical protein